MSKNALQLPRRFRTVGVAAVSGCLLLGACGGGAPETVDASAPSLANTGTLPADAGPGWEDSTTAATTAAGATRSTTPGTQPSVSADGASPSAVLLRAAQNTRSLESFRFDMAMSVVGLSDLPAGSGAFEMKASGAQAANGDSSFVIDMSQMSDLMRAAMEEEGDLGEEAALAEMLLGMFDEPMEMREVGGKSYVKMGGLLGMFGVNTDKPWIVGDVDDVDETGMTDDLGEMVPFIDAENPASILAAINGSGDVQVLGTEDLDGVTTTHYRGVIDPNAAESAETPAERAAIEEALSGMDFEDLTGDPIPTDVWIGDDGFVRRVRFSLDETNMTEAASDGEEFESLTIDLRFSDLDEPITIDAPPADQVTTEDDIADGFGFGDMTFEDEGA